MPVQKAIEHSGFVDEINQDGVKVRFVSESACASCYAKGACSASDLDDKEVFVRGNHSEYKAGERVKIIMKQSQGNQAVLLGYVYPLLFFIFSLLLFNAIGLKELTAGTIALAMLAPYYLGMYFFRNKINKKFSFSIRKYE